MKIINKLTNIYTDWIDKNKLENASADEVLMGTPNLTDKQREWLEKFIKVWDKSNDVERWFYENQYRVNVNPISLSLVVSLVASAL